MDDRRTSYTHSPIGTTMVVVVMVMVSISEYQNYGKYSYQ